MARRGNFLQRLRRSESGNVMYVTAGLLLPIMATIGAGVDLGQAYMAKSRLQQACDAGVLAGRKSMAEGTFDTEAQTAARNMFNFNYPAGIYDSTNISFTPTQRGPTEVTGTATARVNTIIMDMFGKENFPLTVNCTAKLEISNTDIMFVLDVTGSMGGTNSGDSVNKITALKTETMAFYDTIMAAEIGDAQIRMGVVPYSSNVNVGSILMSANPNWLSDSLTTPSRLANFDTVDPPETSTGPTTTWSNVSGFSTWSNTGTTRSDRNSSNCNGTAVSPEYETTTISSGPTTTESVANGANGSTTTTTTTDTNWNAFRYRWRWATSACRLQRAPGIRREREVSTFTNNPPYQVFRDYTHRMITYDVSGLKSGTGLTVPTGTQGANVTASWGGCIIERDTVAFDDAVSTIPSTAYDVNIDLVPNNDATRWKLYVPNISHPRNTNSDASQSPSPADMTTTTNISSYEAGGDSQCVTAAMKLTAMGSGSRTGFNNYINSLTPNGNTYHDVGMVWGARLISPTGLFASENATAPNGSAISRHIIFMTDGEMYPNTGILSFQGHERLHQRVGGGSTDWNELVRRHNRRFLEACSAAKARNITVWVVGFGTALTNELRACASGDKAYQANNSAQLRQQFQSIAQQITRLRLSE
jgi:Flp pilus assembly protein TadG